MKFKKLITTVDAHTEGEPVRLVTGGIPNIPGKTMAEKRDFFAANLDHLRCALHDEPRGHDNMFILVMTPPVTDNADFGIIFMMGPGKRYPNMCGHGSMGVATIAVEMGMVEVKEPVTEVVIDTPSGTVPIRVNVENGKAKSATIRNVPCFLYKTEVVNVPGLGELPVDISFGGNFFTAFVEAKDIGVEPVANAITRAEDLFTKIKESINQQVEIQHPEMDFIRGVNLCILNDRPRNPKANVLNIAYTGEKIMDRSPCGTGTSAKMAVLYGKGELGLGETYVTESIIGSLFYGKLIKEVKVGDFKAVIPEITGRAFIMGMHTFVLDEDDPFKHGFKL